MMEAKSGLGGQRVGRHAHDHRLVYSRALEADWPYTFSPLPARDEAHEQHASPVPCGYAMDDASNRQSRAPLSTSRVKQVCTPVPVQPPRGTEDASNTDTMSLPGHCFSGTEQCCAPQCCRRCQGAGEAPYAKKPLRLPSPAPSRHGRPEGASPSRASGQLSGSLRC